MTLSQMFKTAYLSKYRRRVDGGKAKQFCCRQRLVFAALILGIGMGVIFLPTQSTVAAAADAAPAFISIDLDQTQEPGKIIDDDSVFGTGHFNHADLIYARGYCTVTAAPGFGNHANAAESGNHRTGFVFNFFYYDPRLATD